MLMITRNPLTIGVAFFATLILGSPLDLTTDSLVARGSCARNVTTTGAFDFDNVGIKYTGCPKVNKNGRACIQVEVEGTVAGVQTPTVCAYDLATSCFYKKNGSLDKTVVVGDDPPNYSSCPARVNTNVKGGAVYSRCPEATYKHAKATSIVVTAVNTVKNKKAIYSKGTAICYYGSIELNCYYNADTGCLTGSGDDISRKPANWKCAPSLLKGPNVRGS